MVRTTSLHVFSISPTNHPWGRVTELPGVNSELDYYPAPLRKEIDEVNERVYHAINNGVYKSGFATTQEAYERNVRVLFDALDWLEDLLSTRRYLTGETITEVLQHAVALACR